MKILVACRSFDQMAGGVERMAVALMNEMCRRGHEVTLLTWDDTNARPFYELDPEIKWHKLSMGDPAYKAGWRLRWRRAVSVRKIVKTARPDVMMGFQHGTFLALRLFTLGLGIPTLSAERNAPDRFEFLQEGKRRHLIYLSFLLARYITIQCESYRNSYPAFLRSRIISISNPVFPAQKQADPAGTEKLQKSLLCVGRLSYQKNQEVLVKAFYQLSKEFPDWCLIFAGEGEDRAALEREIAQLNMGHRIILLGAVKEVSDLYSSSHLFCLSSRWEGFPNALAEAMTHGLPVVGFSQCAGVRDLVQDGVEGFLAPGNGDVDSLAKSLGRLMKDSALRENMGRAAAQAMQAYTPQKIFDAWEDLFLKMAE